MADSKKFISLENLGTYDEKIKAYIDDKDAQANVIEGVKVNGTALGITDKVVDITVPTNLSDLNNDAGYVLNSQIQYADDSDIESMFTTAESQ